LIHSEWQRTEGNTYKNDLTRTSVFRPFAMHIPLTSKTTKTHKVCEAEHKQWKECYNTAKAQMKKIPVAQMRLVSGNKHD